MEYKEVLQYAPGLSELRHEAVRLLRDDEVPDFWDRYAEVKGKMNKMVGFHAPKGLPACMYTPEAHDAAFREIFLGLV